MIPAPIDALVALLEALKAPALVVVLLVVFDRLWSWWAFVRDGAGFLSAARQSLQGMVITRTSQRSRAIVHGFVVQTIAVVVIYSIAAIWQEVQANNGFDIHGVFMLHPDGLVMSAVVAAAAIVYGAAAAAVVYGRNRYTSVVLGVEGLLTFFLGGVAVISGIPSLVLAVIRFASNDSIEAAAWLAAGLVEFSLAGGMFLAMKMSVADMRGR